MSIKIPNVSQSLEEKFEKLILGGAFWPDKALASERGLGAEFDVSRTSIRNALTSLTEKGLLTQVGRKYHVTNVLADLLRPGLLGIAGREPKWLLEYWVLLFGDAIALAQRKAQSIDRVNIQKSARLLAMCIEGQDATGATDALDKLARAVFDANYNFFLSQTHYAWFQVAKPYIRSAIKGLCDEGSLSESFEKIGAFGFDAREFIDLLSPGFSKVIPDQDGERERLLDADPIQLVDVILRHPVAVEEVYELRLISEKHAASRAASNATPAQIKAITEQLEKMTRVVDTSPKEYSALDTGLHHMITECTQNPVFSVVDAALAPVFSRTTKQWLQKHLELRNDQSTTHLQHTQIVDAIVAADPGAAQSAMVEHLSYVIRTLRRLREQEHLREIATARLRLT